MPAGYADGIDTRLASRGVVLVRGRRAPIVGAVCMDMLMIDVTDLESRRATTSSSSARRASERIDVREMAAAIGTIPWECSAASERASSGCMHGARAGVGTEPAQSQ